MKFLRRIQTGKLHEYVQEQQRLSRSCYSRIRPSHSHSTRLTICKVSTSKAEIQEKKLQNVLGWLVANGAKGVGDPKDTPKISLFLSNDGERGVLATRNISKGEIIFQVPLKLAVIDEEEGLTEHSMVPWSARLASKIIALKAKGESCPWSAYIESLPECVKNPTSPDFPYSDIQAVAYANAREDIDFSTWVASSSYSVLSEQGGLPTGTTYEEFCLYLSIVHSRTFSVASKERRDGVLRLLMPLVDMLNHSGDVDTNMSDAMVTDLNIIATDACRWDVVPKIGGELIFCVSAVRDIIQGEEITLSYGERSNDDFFIHYGFVPPRNPHDTVCLFDSLEESVTWCLERLSAETKEDLSHEFLSHVHESIMAELDTIDQLANRDTSHLEYVDSKRVLEDMLRIKLQSKGRVDERLAKLLERVYSHISAIANCSAEEFIRNQVARRCFEILLEMKRKYDVDLIHDLDTLVSTEIGVDADDVLSHQFSTMKSTYEPALRASMWWNKLSSVDDSIEDASVSYTQNNDGTASLLSMFEGYNIIDDTCGEEVSMDSHSGNPLPIIYRTYKQLILWDSLLLSR